MNQEEEGDKIARRDSPSCAVLLYLDDVMFIPLPSVIVRISIPVWKESVEDPLDSHARLG